MKRISRSLGFLDSRQQDMEHEIVVNEGYIRETAAQNATGVRVDENGHLLGTRYMLDPGAADSLIRTWRQRDDYSGAQSTPSLNRKPQPVPANPPAPTHRKLPS